MVTRKEEIYFDNFVEMAECACRAAGRLSDLIADFSDVDRKVDEIKTVEHECDQVCHRIMHQLNKAFVTPIDREDINFIAKQIDTITDTIEDAAYSFRMFGIKAVREEAKIFADLIGKSTEELRSLMPELKVMKTSSLIATKVIEINRLENLGDDIYRSAMTRLFAEEKDALEVIKWKQIFEFLEDSLDACEDVANTVEGVVMKNA